MRKVCANPHCGKVTDECRWCHQFQLQVPYTRAKVSFQQLWDATTLAKFEESQLGCCRPEVNCGHHVQTFLEREPPLLFVELERVCRATRVKSHAAVDFPR